MSGPTERPVPADSAPDQSAAEMARSTYHEGQMEPLQVDTPYGTERHGMFGVLGTGDTTGFGGLVREAWVPPAAERPYGGYFDELVDALFEAYPRAADAILKVVVDRGELTLYVAREHLLGLAKALR